MHAIEIDPTTQVAAFVAAREAAWHRLGDFQADRLLTVSEAGERAHLNDWWVHLVPSGALVDPTDPLSWEEQPGIMNVVRTNPFTGKPEVMRTRTRDDKPGKGFVVGDGYQVFQNEQMAEFAQTVAGVFGDEEIVSAAGSMLGGTRAFYCLSLEGFTVLGQDRHDQWLTVLNGHDGTLSLTGLTGATRVVCKNTADWALAESTNSVKVRHSGNMEEKVKAAAEVLGVARDWAAAYGEFAEGLAARKMTDTQFTKMVQGSFGLKPADSDGVRTKNRKARDLEVLRVNFNTSPTTEVGRGTRWGALNAITEWAEWGRPGDQATEQAAVTNLLGTPAQVRAKAVKILTA
jgi:phage/plasmid-like protein (TIGR03299 family)